MKQQRRNMQECDNLRIIVLFVGQFTNNVVTSLRIFLSLSNLCSASHQNANSTYVRLVRIWCKATVKIFKLVYANSPRNTAQLSPKIVSPGWYQAGYVSWICQLDMSVGCQLGMSVGYVSWICQLDMSVGYITLTEVGALCRLLS